MLAENRIIEKNGHRFFSVPLLAPVYQPNYINKLSFPVLDELQQMSGNPTQASLFPKPGAYSYTWNYVPY